MAQSSSSQCSRLVLSSHREVPAISWIHEAGSFTKSCIKGRIRNKVLFLIKYEGFGKSNDGWLNSFSLLKQLFLFYRCDLKEIFLLNEVFDFSVLVIKIFPIQVLPPAPRHHRDWSRRLVWPPRSTSTRRRSSLWSPSSWRWWEVCPTRTPSRPCSHMKR